MCAKAENVKRGSNNREWGIYGEQLAAEYFIKEGYTIRERNWKINKIEIDLILEKDRTIVFVEVKARDGVKHDPILAVDVKKQKRMVNAADIYLRNLPHLYQYRFDIFGIAGTPENYKTYHYPDAFLPSVNGGR